MSNKPLPVKLNKEPLIEVLCAVHFSSDVPAESLLPGLLLSKLATPNPKIETLGAAHDSTFHWVDKVVEFSGRSMEDAALKEIAEITTKLKLSHGESQISAGLSQLSKHELPDIVAIALLRNTFSFRSKVSCWDDFLAATENALSAKGKDSKKLLRGLKK